jgi:hypothetical protein
VILTNPTWQPLSPSIWWASTNRLGPRRLGWPRSAAILLGACLLLLAVPAGADLGSDVARLQLAWSLNARVTRLPARLLERGDPRPLVLPQGSIDPRGGACVTIALLGATSTTFAVRFMPTAGIGRKPDRDHAEQSVAGAIQLVRCGPQRVSFAQLALQMRSPRGIIEVLVAQSDVPVPSLALTLSHRDPGSARERRHFSARPREAPVADRVGPILRRVAREGAVDVRQTSILSGYAGAGGSIVQLDEGCHRFHLVGEPTPQGAPRGVDIDLELLWMPFGEVAVSDYANSSDASALLCVARTQNVALRFVGAAPRTPVVLIRARWNLPQGLPQHWGPRARGQAAAALRRLRAPPLLEPPVQQWLGVTGVTTLPVELIPGACYVGAVATVTGQPHTLGLAAMVGRHHGRNEAGPEDSSSALSFCAPESERGLLEVQALGHGVVWVAGLWQTGMLPVGQEAQ